MVAPVGCTAHTISNSRVPIANLSVPAPPPRRAWWVGCNSCRSGATPLRTTAIIPRWQAGVLAEDLPLTRPRRPAAGSFIQSRRTVVGRLGGWHQVLFAVTNQILTPH